MFNGAVSAMGKGTVEGPLSEQSGQSTTKLENDFNWGPLLTVAIALFGDGSFIQRRVANPGDFMSAAEGNNTFRDRSSCDELMPFATLMLPVTSSIAVVGSGTCSNRNNTMESLQAELAVYARLFQRGRGQDQQLDKALNAAVLLANQAWLLSAENPSRSVYYDLGVDTLVPDIPLYGLILVSVLLTMFLVMLLALAMYSTRHPPWSGELDSFAMMRLGAALYTGKPFLAGGAKAFTFLDSMPGWVGDAGDDKDTLGQLSLGAAGPICQGRKFACFPKSEHDFGGEEEA